jgi:hypothetical protein
MKTYRGIRESVDPYPAEPFVFVEIDGKGRINFETLMLEKSLKVRNHSPTGFEWGYGGSGPHQLALALLMDAIGDDYVAETFYQDFCLAHVMRWSREKTSKGWSITDEYIRAWVKNKQAELN